MLDFLLKFNIVFFLMSQVTLPLAETLPPGEYTVAWHVVSVDGHKTKGQYTFSVK